MRVSAEIRPQLERFFFNIMSWHDIDSFNMLQINFVLVDTGVSDHS